MWSMLAVFNWSCAGFFERNSWLFESHGWIAQNAGVRDSFYPV